MTDQVIAAIGTQTSLAPQEVSAAPTSKGIDLAVLKKGAQDYLEFVDMTKEAFFGYLYHRTGSVKLAQTVLSEVYVSLLSRAMSLWWFGTLGLKLLIEHADHMLSEHQIEEADIDHVFLPALTWLSDEERTSVSSLHDALWTLPREAQRLLVLTMLLGMPMERIAREFRVEVGALETQVATAKDLLLSRWQPVLSVQEKLQSLVFAPTMDIAFESTLRFSVVEKYNLLRFRRYQWVIIAGLFAVMSNVIVASVLAFAVVIQPPTSLSGARTQVAALDAVLLNRETQVAAVKKSLGLTLRESQRVAAYDVSKSLTNAGLSSALNAMQYQQEGEKNVDAVIQILKHASTAMRSVMQIAFKDVQSLLSQGSTF
jgi:DNA-directed RNA polymerase specialized sigma24 family protein